MKLEDLQDQLDSDLKIDATKLQYEAANNPILYSKWLRVYSDVKKSLAALEAKRKTAVKNRLDYYTGRSDGEVCMDSYEKSEMKIVLSADNDVMKVDTLIAYYLNLLDFATKALDVVKSRGFSIKHMIDLRQLESGA
ncbi:recombination, repair and ssDNA binding protein [Serratia phage 4S]|nr:recombination, repair and ssDNA binding protein [Serratia phage 4S]